MFQHPQVSSSVQYAKTHSDERLAGVIYNKPTMDPPSHTGLFIYLGIQCLEIPRHIVHSNSIGTHHQSLYSVLVTACEGEVMALLCEEWCNVFDAALGLVKPVLD